MNKQDFREMPSEGGGACSLSPRSGNMEVMVGTQAALLDHEAGIMDKNEGVKHMEGAWAPGIAGWAQEP